MSWHGEQSGSSIGAHAGMAAKVLRALAAVVVGGAAKAVKLKEHRSQQGEELLTNGLQMRKLRHVNPSQMEKRTDGEDSILIDFCSFASGRGTTVTCIRLAYSPDRVHLRVQTTR